MLLKIRFKSVANTRINTADEKGCGYMYFCQYSKSITDTVGSYTNTAILTALLTAVIYVLTKGLTLNCNNQLTS